MLPTVFSRARGWISACDITGLRPEALDDAADERADARRGDQHRGLALAGGLLEALAHEGDEFRQPGRLHRQAAVVALADDRFGEILFPFADSAISGR